jgi:hypothetical protein
VIADFATKIGRRSPHDVFDCLSRAVAKATARKSACPASHDLGNNDPADLCADAAGFRTLRSCGLAPSRGLLRHRLLLRAAPR